MSTENNATIVAPQTVTVDLEYPVAFEGKTISKLTFRRRKARDLVVMDLIKGEQRKHMSMLASMADVPLPVIEELDGDDWDAVTDLTLPLMGKSVARAVGNLLPQSLPVVAGLSDDQHPET